MVTIYDIAKEANVSPATVSRVLNRQGNVRDETAQKVLRVAKARKYAPNAMARSLRTKKTSLIGLIIPDIENPIYPAPVRGIQDVANRKDYSVIIQYRWGRTQGNRYYTKAYCSWSRWVDY